MSQMRPYDTAYEGNRLLESSEIVEHVSHRTIQSEHIGRTANQRQFAIPRKPLPQYTSIVAPVESESDLGDTPPRVDRNLLAWRPFYLRTPILIAFILFFCALIAALETIYQVSERQHGLVSSKQRLHYLWTYGPSTVFIVIATFWARLEYQTKELTPWQTMVGKEAEATKSVLLDYVSAFQFVTIYTALSNRHFTVVSAALCNILFKVLIVFSTALIILSPTQVLLDNVPMIISSTFSGDVTALNNSGTLPFDLLQAVELRGLQNPLGVTQTLAYQSFNSSTILSGAKIRASVDVLIATLECEQAQMTVNSWWAESYANYPSGIPPMVFGQLDFLTSDCRISQDANQYGSMNFPDSNATEYYAVYQSGYCGQSGTDSEGRVVVAAGITHGGDQTTTQYGNFSGSPATTTRTNITVSASTQYICKPILAFTTAEVMFNQSDTSNVTVQTSSIPKSSASTINGISAWDFVKFQFGRHNEGWYWKGGSPISDINETAVTLSIELNYGFALAKFPVMNFTELLQNDRIATAANSYFGAITAMTTHLSIISSTSIPANGTAEITENRLLVKKLSVRVMEVILAAVILLTILISFFEKNVSALPRNPSTLLSFATLIEHSRGYLGLFKGTGSTSIKTLQQRLGGRRYTSGIVGTGDAAHFAIHVGHQGREHHFPHTINQTATVKFWQPFIISKWGYALACIALVLIIVVSEILLWISHKHQGLASVSLDGYVHYSWAYAPATILILTSMWYTAINFDMRCVAPYLGLKQKSSASRTISLSYLDEISGTTLFRSAKRRQWTILFTTIASVIGSTLTIAVSGVYSTANIPQDLSIQIQATSLFATYYYDSNFQDGDLYGGVTTGLIMYGNLSYPSWTYDELAFPQFSVINSSGSMSNIIASGTQDEIRARVTATRSNYICRLYGYNDINYNLNWTDPLNTLRVNVSNEYCGEFAVGTLYVNPDQYFGAVDDHEDFCSQRFYFWGVTRGRNIDFISAIGCNETFNDVETDIVLVGPSMKISTDMPPKEDDSTLRPVYHEMEELFYSQSYLPTINTPSNSNLDSVFMAIVYGKDGIPLTDLGDSTQIATVVNRTNHVNSVLRAQYLNEFAREAVNSSTIPAPLKATFSQQDRLRLVQDPIASRILEVLLCVMLICTILAMSLTNIHELVPKNPCSIAAKSSLLAESSLVTRKFLPEDAERISEGELNAIAQGYNFGIGWFDGNEKGTKVYKVDVISSTDRISRISVKPK